MYYLIMFTSDISRLIEYINNENIDKINEIFFFFFFFFKLQMIKMKMEGMYFFMGLLIEIIKLLNRFVY